MTPEGKVKNEVKKLLLKFQLSGGRLFTFMPVQTGYGKKGLDFHCIVEGRSLVIETKAPGEWLTGPQRDLAKAILEAGSTLFIISNDDGLDALARWLRLVLKEM